MYMCVCVYLVTLPLIQRVAFLRSLIATDNAGMDVGIAVEVVFGWVSRSRTAEPCDNPARLPQRLMTFHSEIHRDSDLSPSWPNTSCLLRGVLVGTQ